MNTASIDLCKELYELSGWEDYELPHYAERCDHAEDYEYIMSNDFGDAFPAYNLGYLLRKLPPSQISKKKIVYYLSIIAGHSTGGFVVGYLRFHRRSPSDTSYWWKPTQGKGKTVTSSADTPEDAACKLVIELIKQGILNPEEDV